MIVGVDASTMGAEGPKQKINPDSSFSSFRNTKIETGRWKQGRGCEKLAVVIVDSA